MTFIRLEDALTAASDEKDNGKLPLFYWIWASSSKRARIASGAKGTSVAFKAGHCYYGTRKHKVPGAYEDSYCGQKARCSWASYAILKIYIRNMFFEPQNITRKLYACGKMDLHASISRQIYDSVANWYRETRIVHLRSHQSQRNDR